MIEINKKVIHINLVFILICLVNLDCKAQASENDYFSYQSVLDSLCISENYKGISAAIIYPDGRKWIGASGISHVNTPISDGMLYGIASITKTFVAATILKLVEQKYISLDDEISKWLNPIKNVDMSVTITQLLNHTSGIYNFTVNPDYYNYRDTNPNKQYTNEEILSYIREKDFIKGTSWKYSNTNYYLLGIIIEKTTGKQVSQVIRDMVLTPLKLQNTFFCNEEEIIGNFAHPWIGNDDIHEIPKTAIYSSMWTSAAIVSTPEDVATFYTSIFKNGFIPEALMNKMNKFIPISEYPLTGYGLGIYRAQYRDRELWCHSGLIEGYSSFAAYDCKSRISIAVCINKFMVNSSLPVVVLLDKYISILTSLDKEKKKLNEFKLGQNYPNPFNPVTEIIYELPEQNNVQLKVYDLLGKEIATLIDRQQNAGEHSLQFNAGNLQSGIYFYSLKAGDFYQTRKMTILK